MALNIKCQLSESKGLDTAIYFTGLEHDVVIHPTIHGEPILTSQAFYYLEHLESVAEIRFEKPSDQLPDNQIEYLIDNYLFMYSTIHDHSRMTTKVTEYKYWKNSIHNMYLRYDNTSTEALVLDEANDESVLEISSLESTDNTYFGDWCLVKNYSDDIINNYVLEMQTLIGKKIMIKVMPTADRDGYMGKIRLLECSDGLIDYHQAQYLDYRINSREIKPHDPFITLPKTSENGREFELPIETITSCNLYNPLLLSYYFSGLKESNPLLSFVGFYNVIEYYFEEAPILLSQKALYEKEQLKCVVELLVSGMDICKFIKKQSSKSQSIISANIETSSKIEIEALDIKTKGAVVENLATWLYSIRCAVVHSKKTRRGKETAIFEPYSQQAENVKIALPLMKWLSIKCIEKDYSLGNGKTSLKDIAT